MDHVVSESKSFGIKESEPSQWKPVKTPREYQQSRQKLNVESKKMLKSCTACSHPISIKAEICPNCGNPTGVHVCPKCNSINTKVITGASKATSIFLWGAFAGNKVMSKYQCKDCEHKW